MTEADRKLMRQIAIAAGYSVHERSSHGIGPAYDWSPKSPMEGRHFKSAEGAWADLEGHLWRRLQEAKQLIAIEQQLTVQA